jgi:hypothetical protein
VKKKPALAGFFISKIRVARIQDNKKAGNASFSCM